VAGQHREATARANPHPQHVAVPFAGRDRLRVARDDVAHRPTRRRCPLRTVFTRDSELSPSLLVAGFVGPRLQGPLAAPNPLRRRHPLVATVRRGRRLDGRRHHRPRHPRRHLPLRPHPPAGRRSWTVDACREPDELSQRPHARLRCRSRFGAQPPPAASRGFWAVCSCRRQIDAIRATHMKGSATSSGRAGPGDRTDLPSSSAEGFR
jgi:hypothetical protein